jgi:hypothetical protein
LLAKKRPLLNMVVSNAIITAADGGLAGRSDIKIEDNLYIVGYWIAKRGLLSNGSFASAKATAKLALND